jgi:uncharacterized phage protein gp47/JayE
MFQIPSLVDLVARARRSFRAHLPGSDAWLWPNNINPTAKVIAGMTHEAFGFIDYTARQKFALTADSENLDLHGEELGLARRPAQPARGAVRISAQGALTVAPGAVFRRADGQDYRALVAGQRLSAGDLDIDVVAMSDGKATSAIAGTPLEIVSGVTGAALAEVAPSGIAGGADIEDDESFRARILFRKRYPPHGGSAADYVMWAQAVSGVTRVFVERLWQGPGTVRVFVLMDDLYEHGLAPEAEIARVRDHIETLRPSGAIVTVSAPAAHPVDIEIAGLSPDTSAMRATVVAELRGMFRRLSRVAGSDQPHGGMPFLATPETFSRSWIWQAVANAAGETRHEIASPAGDVGISAGAIATLGSVTFAGGA